MIIWNEPIEFDWDEGNKHKNKKHELSNSEIEEIFFDQQKMIAYDHKHSKIESRHIVIGRTKRSRYMYVVITVRKGKVRVISARYMHKKEVELYEKATKLAKVQE